MQQKKSRRTLNWDIVFYPESAPAEFRSIFDDMKIEYAISPLHDKDMNPDGEPKKAHFHAVLCFPSVKTFEQVCEVIAPLNCPIPQPCNSLKGSVQYFTHKNNPEKYQYSASDIVCGGGLDLSSVLSPTATERRALIEEMQWFVRNNQIVEFQDLMDYACLNERDTWYPLLCDNSAYVINLYIKSQRHRQKTDSSFPPEGGA